MVSLFVLLVSSLFLRGLGLLGVTRLSSWRVAGLRTRARPQATSPSPRTVSTMAAPGPEASVPQSMSARGPLLQKASVDLSPGSAGE